MYECFTNRAREVMQLANKEAKRFNHEYIGTEHLLLGLLKEDKGVAAHVLKNLDLDARKIRLEVEKIIQPGPDRVVMGRLPQTPWTKKILEYAIDEAKNLHHNYIGTEHLLLGLLHGEECVAAQVLMNLGLNRADVRKEVLQLLGYEITSEESHSGRTLVRRWAKSDTVAENAKQESNEDTARKHAAQDAQRERIYAMEQQLWNVRVVLGALAGVLAGSLLAASIGAVLGLIIGGMVAALGRRIPAVLTGGVAGVLLDVAHLPDESGGVAGALLGILAGLLIAEIGAPTDRRGFANLWRRK